MELSHKEAVVTLAGIANHADCIEIVAAIQDQTDLVLLDVAGGNEVAALQARFMAIHQYAEMALSRLGVVSDHPFPSRVRQP